MTSSISNGYMIILLSVAAASFCIFFLGLYWMLRAPAAKGEGRREKAGPSVPDPLQNKLEEREYDAVSSADFSGEQGGERKPSEDIDFTSISGDDVLATQLDLARAYIETGKKQQARRILNSVLTQGSAGQQQEAQQLLNSF